MITCPACGCAAPPKKKFSVAADEAAQHFVLAEADQIGHARLVDHICSLWHSSSCEIVECINCRLGFAWPFVAGDGEFYNLAWPHSDYPKTKWEFSTTVDALAKADNGDKRALEIGSGFGYFLKHVSPRFFDQRNIVAIEYNDTASARLKANGYTVFQKDIRSEEFDKFDKAFDCVFMFQVLEHMDDLDELVVRLRFVTKEHADVFVAVPNPKLVEFNERHGSLLLEMPPNHISCWKEKSFVAFGAKAGFDVLEFQEEPMSWLAFLKQDILFSYLQRCQRSGSLENRIRSKRKTSFRRTEEAVLAVLASPRRFRAWIAAALGGLGLGGSVWVHLRRN